MDGAIPRRELPAVLNRMKALPEESGLRILNVFHAGAGNPHPLLLQDVTAPGEIETVETTLCAATDGEWPLEPVLPSGACLVGITRPPSGSCVIGKGWALTISGCVPILSPRPIRTDRTRLRFIRPGGTP